MNTKASKLFAMNLDCEEGDVRLTQGNEGTVEVCLNSLWGMIAQSGWSTLDGQVVCRQLGYTSEGDFSMLVSL